MSSEARIAANRRNAGKSTGPRTPETSKADCAKQSQFPGVTGGSGTAVGATPSGCPARAQGSAPTAGGERLDHRQSFDKLRRPLRLTMPPMIVVRRRRPILSNKANQRVMHRAKQSQSRRAGPFVVRLIS